MRIRGISTINNKRVAKQKSSGTIVERQNSRATERKHDGVCTCVMEGTTLSTQERDEAERSGHGRN